MQELGVLAEDEAMSASQGAFCLLRFQHQVDAWQAQRIALILQTRTVFTLTSGSSTVTLGPSGATVTMQRPVWVNTVNYIIPGSAPATESPIAPMDEDRYADLSIKALSSTLPTEFFYQTSLDTVLGSLFFWPTVSQNVQIALYTPQGLIVPATLDSVITGPPGCQDALMYQLALRLATPFGVALPPALPGLAERAWTIFTSANVRIGQLSTDPSVLTWGGAGYNIYTDR